MSAFVDYKVDDDNSGKDIVFQLINLGAKIEKTFNRKVFILYRNTNKF